MPIGVVQLASGFADLFKVAVAVCFIAIIEVGCKRRRGGKCGKGQRTGADRVGAAGWL